MRDEEGTAATSETVPPESAPPEAATPETAGEPEPERFNILRIPSSERPKLPNPRAVTVQELQNVIRAAVPEGEATKRPVQQTPKAVAGPTGFALWAAVREPNISPANAFDEVYPNILLGNRELAEKPHQMELFSITHVLNAAEGHKFNQVNTTSATYDGVGIHYVGVPAEDVANYRMYRYFTQAADYVEEALGSGGRVYVHCVQGLSRSATLVVAFLMLKRSLTVTQAFETVRRKRAVFPNYGFLKQLCLLNDQLFQ